MKNCVFCGIVTGDIPSHTIFQNELVAVLLDVNPVSSGHLLVIPKEHVEKLHNINDIELATALMTALVGLSKKLLENNFCTDYSLIQI